MLKSFPGALLSRSFSGCLGCCSANEKVYILLKQQKQKKFHNFIHTSLQKLISSDGWERMFTREWPSASRNCLHSNGRFWAKFMRNTGHGGQLKAICPEIFFDILTGGCIFNP